MDNDGLCVALVLAAGRGTRMQSHRPKVLHEIARRPMLGFVLDAARGAGVERTGVVIAKHADAIAQAVHEADPAARLYVQQEQLGTAHAVSSAGEMYKEHAGSVLVLFGDTPLVRSATLMQLRQAIAEGADMAVLAFEAHDPTGYGRVLLDSSGAPRAIREHRDASPEELKTHLCNSGVMAFRASALRELLPRIGKDNAKGEYYLSDAVALAHADGLQIAIVTCSEAEVIGINDHSQLAQAEALMQSRLRAAAMAAGVTLMAPETVSLSHDTRLEKDVVIEPHVVFGPGVIVGEGARINAFSHIEGAIIHPGAMVGPFARLRPGAQIGPRAKIGNFVEIKKASIEEGAKVNHLTYIGDARVGPGANIGAGTVTCNYDGFAKHFTDIGARAFIGSNSSLVAPVKIGEGAYIGSGSVITKDVEPDALALSRTPQEERPGWAGRTRQRRNKSCSSTG